MANLQHLKASRVQILNAFPGNDFGKDGDIACANINGKGAYLCIKNNGRWFVADKLNDISQLDKPKMENLKVDSLAIRNAKLDTSKQKGDFTLDAHGNIELNTDGGRLSIKMEVIHISFLIVIILLLLFMMTKILETCIRYKYLNMELQQYLQ